MCTIAQTNMIDDKIREILITFQKNEITEHHVYRRLAHKVKGRNSEILDRISKDELRHYSKWKEYTLTEVPPSKLTILKFLIISKIFGLTFALKIMEEGEEKAEEVYASVTAAIPEANDILREETEHEELLVGMIDEERISYIGSMVLGLSDALVESIDRCS